MSRDPELPTGAPHWLARVPLDGLLRIDAALEGDWSGTVGTLWTREGGVLPDCGGGLRHGTFRPCLELYFDAGWVGMHCFEVVDGEFVFDRKLASAIVDYVEGRLAMDRPGCADG